ncbi:uncharacterized protein [Parasteatoda tepidariorum]|nr:uncharacterized protein LOC107452614 isoform X2 [Parasteatoda tepidariorum]XP_015924630.2 uncharacterized protein LOC107452614 isoform X1 [Parasteatoda tepidariorum]XP_015924631.2 uncharacterized protein LOC107452614 isoform X1 [Parasteatoda tepidariorum]XP_015924632.2 uncharacterized protein LOC107452614 isoform X1 [Parasteatoda tepidariorum]
MNRLSQSLVSNTTPSSLLQWLTEELEKRDIDTVYARYIVSLLQQDCADVEPSECCHNRFYQLKGFQKCCILKNSFPFSKLKHQKFKKSAKQMMFMHSCLHCNKKCLDVERLKRNAAVECLQSTYHDVDDVEELVDQVYIELKNIKNQKVGEKEKVYRSTCGDRIENSFFRPASSSSSDIQKYFDDFPCLSSSEENVSVENCNNSIWDRKPFRKTYCFENNTVHSPNRLLSVKSCNQPVIPYKFLKTIKNVYKTDSSLIINHDKALIQCSGIDIDNFISSLGNALNAQTFKLLVNQFIRMKLKNRDIKPKLKLPLWTSLSVFNNIAFNGLTLSLKTLEKVECYVIKIFREMQSNIYLNYLIKGIALTFIFPASGISFVYLFIFSIKNLNYAYKTKSEALLNFSGVNANSDNVESILKLLFSSKTECSKNINSKKYIVLKYFQSIEECLLLNGTLVVNYAVINQKLSTKLLFEAYLKAIILFSGLQVENYNALVFSQVCLNYDHDVVDNTKVINDFISSHVLYSNELKSSICDLKKTEKFSQSSLGQFKSFLREPPTVKNHTYSSIPLFSNVGDSSFRDIHNYIATESITRLSKYKLSNCDLSSLKSDWEPYTEYMAPVKSAWEPCTELSENYPKLNDKKWLFFWGDDQSAIENIWLNDLTSKKDPTFDNEIINLPETWDINNDLKNFEFKSSNFSNLVSDPIIQKLIQSEGNVEQYKSRFDEIDLQNLYDSQLNIWKPEPFDIEFSNDSFSEFAEERIFDLKNLNTELLQTNNVNETVWSTESSYYMPPECKDAVISDSLTYDENKADWDSNFYFEDSYSSSTEFELAASEETKLENQFNVTECEDDSYLSTSLSSTNYMDKNIKQNHYFMKKPCSFYLQGNCFRNDCKYSHDVSTITCRFWKEGDCFKGVTCPFLHGETSPKEESCKKRCFKKTKVFKTREIYSLESEKDFPSLSANNSEIQKITKSDPINIIQDKSSKKKKNRNKHLHTSV